MKKILALFIILVSFAFAIDKEQTLEAIKSNPSLLNTPQAQQILKEKGLSKEQVLQKINSQNQINENQPTTIKNDVFFENNETNNLKPNKKVLNLTDYTNPLKYIPEDKLIAKIKSVAQTEKKVKLQRFADRFFYNRNKLSSQILAVPDYYQLNPKDVVLVQVFGGNDKSYQLVVDNNGNIKVPILGPIHVAGLSVREVKDMLKSKLKPTYPNSKIIVNVKISSFIQVSLTGYVKAPGVYNLQSISTIKDLLITAGGIGNVGSIRNVILKRNGRVFKTVDFYDLIKDGKIVDTTLLQNGDVVYIPKAKKLVKLSGDVNIPAIYELKQGEKLKDLISFAGNLKPDASKKYIKIKRYVNNSYTKVYFKSLNSDFNLKNGDEIYVYKISALNKDYVYVYGNIDKPGSFEIPKTYKLKDLVKKLNFLKNTYYDYALLERFDGKIISFNIKNPGNIKLLPKDTVYVFNKYEVEGEQYITFEGNITKAFDKLKYQPNMKLKDAITLAGINDPLFYKDKIEILRYKNAKPYIFFVSLNKNPDFKLYPYDKIYLFKITDFNPIKPVTVLGEVNKPGIYTYTKNETLKEAIDQAAGFTPKADKNYIELVRYYIKDGVRGRQIYKLTDKNLSFILKPFDEISVKTIPNWGKVKYITLKGEVKYPGKYVIKTGDRLADVIKRAGGFTKNAYLYGTVFTRESVRKMQEERIQNMIYKLKRKVTIIAASAKGAGESNIDANNLISAIDSLAKEAEKLKPTGRIAIKLDSNLTKFTASPYNIEVKNKDTLYIPSRKDSVIVMGEVLNEGAFVYKSDKAIDYIKNAGGVTDDAGEIFFVVHANGLTEKGELDGWFRKSVNVKPGDVITVPLHIKTATWYGIAKDITSIVYQLAITAASLKTVGAF